MDEPIVPRPYGSRAEHLAWCKARALEYLPHDPAEALASMFSDLRKHDEFKNHSAIELGAMLMFNGHLQTARQVREYIEGFN